MPTSVATTNATLTTTWQRFTLAGTFGATAISSGIGFTMTPTGTAGANDYYEVTGVQLEIGSQATPFTRAAGTIQGELAACQRYFQNYSGSGLAFCNLAYFSTTSAYGEFAFPIMRTAPTGTISATGLTVFSNGGGLTSSAVTIALATPSIVEVQVTTPVAVTGAAAFARFISTAALELSAEL
jgi:hypothetical protein